MVAGGRNQVGFGRWVTCKVWRWVILLFWLLYSVPRWWKSTGIGFGSPAAARSRMSLDGIGLGKCCGGQRMGKVLILGRSNIGL